MKSAMTVWVDEEIKSKIDKICDLEMRSQSNAINKLLKERFQNGSN